MPILSELFYLNLNLFDCFSSENLSVDNRRFLVRTVRTPEVMNAIRVQIRRNPLSKQKVMALKYQKDLYDYICTNVHNQSGPQEKHWHWPLFDGTIKGK